MRIVLGLLWLLAAPQEGKLRVACVGDSITFGARVEDREKNAYPTVLQALLGEGHEVRNFGVSGATLLKKGDKPWWKEGAFKAATDFNPQIVVIKLGTNDTKPQNWKHKGEFQSDLTALIAHFRDLPARPKVWLVAPAPVLKDNFGINAKDAAEQRPLLEDVAKKQGCPLIDLAELGRPEFYDKDGVHPNAAGARFLAERVHAALRSP